MDVNRVECKLDKRCQQVPFLAYQSTDSQQACPHGSFKSSHLRTPSADPFSQVNHHWPKILDVFQALRNFLQSSHIIWPREDPDKVMALSDGANFQAWAEEDLFELRFALRSVGEPVEQAIYRQTLFA